MFTYEQVLEKKRTWEKRRGSPYPESRGLYKGSREESRWRMGCAWLQIYESSKPQKVIQSGTPTRYTINKH